ncbi:MAG TPA: sigma 54-interacting transcriptional regulator, partial [Candidatus Polarisedimenticolia bacterium]|nr:sigma 54-interacting transcriptional regulator [Candidatus Polarisedimenticolia bacterium]
GHPGEDLKGRLCREVFDEETCRQIEPRHLSIEGDTAHFNVTLSGSEDCRRAYCFTAAPARDNDGRVVGILENFRGMDKLRDLILDLEEVSRIARREKEKTDRILNSIADGIFTVDRERRIVSFSDKMERLTGIPAARAIGSTCMEVLRGSKCDSDCPLRWSFEHGQVVENCSETLRAVDDRRIPVFVTTAFQYDVRGAAVGLTGVVHDRSELERLRHEVHERHSRHNLIGRSRAIQEILQIIESVAESDATVLITGESGTGKEIVAKALHHASGRKDRPFVMLNCAALNDNLLESELFGHVRGAFTGAVKDKPGRFELAVGGTIFLDEIGDTSPALQAKLLRVLQEKEFERVGDLHTRKVDVRIIAATNRDLWSLVRGGRFREDLYYRLAVVPVHLPPLRERREDIPLLVQHFIDLYRPRYFRGREEEFEGISNRALALMMAHDWPGNVRELEHAVEYAMISTTSNRIERAFLPAPLRRLQPPDSGTGDPLRVPSADAPVAEARPGEGQAGPPRVESPEAILQQALARNRWNATRTARDLGISRTTLWRRMKSLDLLRSPSKDPL